MVKERIHPSHARTSRLILFACILLSVIPFGAAFYAANELQDSGLETLFSVLFMISLLAVGLVATLRLYLGRCPECRGWMRRQQLGNGDAETVKFHCKACSIVWDSQIKVDN